MNPDFQPDIKARLQPIPVSEVPHGDDRVRRHWAPSSRRAGYQAPVMQLYATRSSAAQKPPNPSVAVHRSVGAVPLAVVYDTKR